MERKKYPVEQKLKIVQECLETGNCAVVARRYGLSSSMVNRWMLWHSSLSRWSLSRVPFCLSIIFTLAVIYTDNPKCNN
ncbi:MAG: helix-turn-helix domain-containing protein [Moorella humiferrea]|nr:helix-turn-helix domain-containing protein [Moorella humiferrea]